MRRHDGEFLDPDSNALVAHDDGGLEFLLSPDDHKDLSRSQLFLAAVALRSTDREWFEEQIAFIAEVRRQLAERDAARH